jgi:hypothetical protein
LGTRDHQRSDDDITHPLTMGTFAEVIDPRDDQQFCVYRPDGSEVHPDAWAGLDWAV